MTGYSDGENRAKRSPEPTALRPSFDAAVRRRCAGLAAVPW
jgi:hypothetical protein